MSYLNHLQPSLPLIQSVCFQKTRLLSGFGLSLGIVAGAVLAPQTTLAQIVPDDTLGSERSQVTSLTDPSGITIDFIQGGAQRGGNLFHSFRDFSVAADRGAFFVNPSNDLQNILARVTGNSRSDILGGLGILNAPGVTSNPNLFLINPNGILFGPNATLNVGGSFLATTANAVRLGDSGFFSASAPATSNLLSINPSALVFNQSAAQPISLSTATLQVPNGNSLLLVGGDVTLDGSRLVALDGNIQLASLAGSGTVGLTVNGTDLNSTVPSSAARGDVTLKNRALAGVFGNNGRIAATARNINFLNGSGLGGGITNTFGATGGRSGDIILNASEGVTLEQGSRIATGLDSNVTGTGGNIRITTRTLSLTGRSFLSSTTAGQGNAGNISILARDGILIDGEQTGILAGVEQAGRGNAGNVTVRTGSLVITNGAGIQTNTLGRGDAGDVTIHARNLIALDAISDSGVPSSILAGVLQGGVGNAGNVNIRTNSLSATRGGIIGVATRGQGNAGDVTIHARTGVSLDGQSRVGASGVAAGVLPEGIGNAGSVTILTGDLFVTNGASVQAGTLNRGNGGNVTVVARNTVRLSGIEGSDSPLGLLSNVASGATGNAGNIVVRTGSLHASNAGLVAATGGQGNAGSITVEARDSVRFDAEGGAIAAIFPGGVGNAGDIRINAGGTVSFDGGAGAVASVFFGGTGNAGSVRIRANVLDVSNNSAIAASSLFGSGNAGSVTVDVRDRASVTSGGNLSATTFGGGTAGSVRINAGNRLSLSRGELTVASLGQQNAGDLVVSAPFILLDDRGKFNAASILGRGGDIRLNASNALVLRRTSTVNAQSSIRGNDGNIGINTDFVVAVPTENSDIVAFASRTQQQGGSNIDINAAGVFGIEFQEALTPQSDITATGTVTITPPDVDPNRGLVELPTDLVDATNQIAQGCSADNVANGENLGEFVVTGRGGLPPNPDAILSDEEVSTDWIEPPTGMRSPAPASRSSQPIEQNTHTPVVEAQGWVISSTGQIMLTSNADTTSAHPPVFTPASCHT
ncbi:MAG TPA: S-layer family protein [Crinalium sp.]